MTLLNYDSEIREILSKLQSENSTLDYKSIPYKNDKRADFIKDVVAMLNSEEGYGYNKYIIFGVVNKSLECIGLKVDMPDDNEYQDLVCKIRPRPAVQTGCLKFENLWYGYIRISASNDERVYEVARSHQEAGSQVYEGQAFIRKGSVNYIMNNEERRRVEKAIIENNQYSTIKGERSVVVLQSQHKNGLAPLTSASLIGAWKQTTEGDQKIIEEFVEQEFSNWLAELQQLKAEENTDIKLVQGIWKIENRKDFLLSVKSSIFDNHIDALMKIAIKLLSGYDPKYDLPTGERSTATIYGKNPIYSEFLVAGVAEALAIVSSMADEFNNCSRGTIKSKVYNAVYKILENKDWRTWESIGWNLSYLAEASPDAFLRVLEEECAKSTNTISQLLNEKDGWLAPTNCGDGLIRALQILAWDKDYFGSACMLLARMSEYWDKIQERLVSILLPWHPQTSAPSHMRIAIIKRIAKDLNLASWTIIKGLLPNQTRTSMAIDKPKYLSGNYETNEIKVAEFWDVSKKYLEIGLEVIAKHIEQMIEVVDLLDDVNPEMREEIIKMLVNNENSISDDLLRYRLWDKLSSFTNRQRNFSDTTWALSEEMVLEIDKIAELYAPKDFKLKISRLFKNEQYDLLDDKENHEEASRILMESKDTAISALYIQENFKGVLDLAVIADKPDFVGMSLARLGLGIDIDKQAITLFDEAESKEASFSRGYIWQSFVTQGYDWVNQIEISDWNESKRAALLILLSFKEETWELVSSWLGENQTLYWKQASVWRTECECPDYVLEWLLMVQRPETAIQLLANAIIQDVNCNMEIAFEALEQYLKKQDEQDTMSSYYISKIICWLQIKCEDKERLSHLEWQYFNLLDDECKPTTLFAKIASNPDFFMELVCLVYKRRNSSKGERTSVDEQTEKLATHAWKVLNKWKHMPGKQDENTISKTEMDNWIAAVKKISEIEDRYEIAMEYLGQVAFYAPKSEDGFFINEFVAEMLDERESEYQRRGYQLEALNSRGVHSVDPKGNEEIAIAISWEEKAEEAEKRSYFIFAKTLRNIEDSYRRESIMNVEGYMLEKFEDE